MLKWASAPYLPLTTRAKVERLGVFFPLLPHRLLVLYASYLYFACDCCATDGGCASVDGFVVVNILSVLLGVGWYFVMHRRVLDLETLKQREWQTGSGGTFWGPSRGRPSSE
jgi:hypothetical protein